MKKHQVLHRAPKADEPQAPFTNLPPEITRAEFFYTDDSWIQQQILQNANGEEVDATAHLAPPRIASIPKNSTFYFYKQGSWTILTASSDLDQVDVTQKTNPAPGLEYFETAQWNFEGEQKQYRGVVVRYTTQGHPFYVGYFGVRPAGTDEEIPEESAGYSLRQTLGKGNPLMLAAKENDAAAVQTLWDLGLWQSPGAAFHAALVGQSELSVRIQEAQKKSSPAAPLFADPRQRSSRPHGVPPEAIYVPGYGAYVLGNLPANGKLNGSYQAWECDCESEKAKLGELAFENGQLAHEIRHKSSGKVETKYFTSGPKKGEERFSCIYRGPHPESEIEYLENGDYFSRKYASGKLQIESYCVNDTVTTEKTFSASGEAISLTEPAPQARKLTVFSEGKPRLTGFLDFDGHIINTFQILNLDGTVASQLNFDDYFNPFRCLSHEDLLPFVTSFQKLIQQAEGDSKIWEKHKGHFIQPQAVNAFILGMASPDPAMFGYCLSLIWQDAVHDEIASERCGLLLESTIPLLTKTENAKHQMNLLEFSVGNWEFLGENRKQTPGLSDNVDAAFKKSEAIFKELATKGLSDEVRQLAADYLEIQATE